MKKIATLLAATAIVSTFAFAASAKTLVYCSEASPANFDPSITTGGNDFDASSRTVYSRLVEFKHGSTELEPGLAESLDRFRRRPDIHIQASFRCEVPYDVLLHAEPRAQRRRRGVLLRAPVEGRQRVATAYMPNITWDYFQGMDMPKYLKTVEKVDDLTVKITLTEPNAPMLANLGMDFAFDRLQGICREAGWMPARRRNSRASRSEPVLSSSVDYQLDSVIRYSANPDFYRGKEKIDDLIFAITPDASARMQKIAAGECDIMPYPNPADIKALKANADLEVMEQAGLNIGYMSYNTTLPPFDKAEVRKALNMAINKKSLMESLSVMPARRPRQT